MVNNLIPPFLMREAGLVVNDKPKTHTEDPTVKDHALIFRETGFRIPLSIHGIFSFFQTTKSTTKELQAGHDVYILTLECWNPHTDAYSLNEASMLDWEGNMRERGEWTNKIVLDDEVDGDMDETHFTISTIEGQRIDEVCKENEQTIAEMGEVKRVPKECDQVAMVLGEISSVLGAHTLDRLLRRRADLARDEGTIGATTAIEQEFLLGDEINDNFDDGSEERPREMKVRQLVTFTKQPHPVLELTSSTWIKYSPQESKQSTKGRPMQDTLPKYGGLATMTQHEPSMLRHNIV